MEVAVTELDVMISSRVTIRMMGNTNGMNGISIIDMDAIAIVSLSSSVFTVYYCGCWRYCACPWCGDPGTTARASRGTLRCLHVSFPHEIPGTNST
eukprot:scaffold5975_cov64-Cyclotella_meneghiniana.AAC.11